VASAAIATPPARTFVIAFMARYSLTKRESPAARRSDPDLALLLRRCTNAELLVCCG
jgi:hypothetical protein